MVAREWVESLKECGELCLQTGLEKALSLTDLNTVVLVLRNK